MHQHHSFLSAGSSGIDFILSVTSIRLPGNNLKAASIDERRRRQGGLADKISSYQIIGSAD